MGCDSAGKGSSAFWPWLPVLTVAGLLIVIYGGSALRGDSPALWWKAWGVPAMEPSFFDASAIGTWFDLHRSGVDPSLQNPLDSLERTLNYPPTIFVFSVLGWSHATTPLVGLGFALLYLGCIAALTGGIGRWQSLFWTLLACSPAALLAVERGNMDILILALVVLSMHLAHKPWVSAFALTLATLWKLFAVVGIGALLVGNRGQRVAGAVALLLSGFSFWLMRDSIFTTVGSLANESTNAFGINAAANFWIQNGNPGGLAEGIRSFSLPIAIALALSAALAGFFHRAQPSTESPQDIFGAWIGALLFGALFLSGTQFDYKLLFLWPMVPWVWKKATMQEGIEFIVARLWLLCLVLAAGWFFFSTDNGWRVFFLKQSLTWVLFFTSAFLGGRLVQKQLEAFR